MRGRISEVNIRPATLLGPKGSLPVAKVVATQPSVFSRCPVVLTIDGGNPSLTGVSQDMNESLVATFDFPVGISKGVADFEASLSNS